MQQEPLEFWPHKDLLDVDQLSLGEINQILDLAKNLYTLDVHAKEKKEIIHTSLKGKRVILFFIEPSTRTKLSFEIAGKTLCADVVSLIKSTSSIEKGESLKDTVLTLQAMQPDIIVLRHSNSGAPYFLAEKLSCSVINAGDGLHAHPTQALIDLFLLYSFWGKSFSKKTLVIIGDTGHSRVCRSNVKLFTMLGATVRLCSPRTLLPAGVEHWPVEVFTDMQKAVKDVDAIMCLRLQYERQKTTLLPKTSEYAKRFCLMPEHLLHAKPAVKVLHPGPFLRELDISSAVVDGSSSLVFEQVSAGVAVRMALLNIFATYKNRFMP